MSSNTTEGADPQIRYPVDHVALTTFLTSLLSYYRPHPSSTSDIPTIVHALVLADLRGVDTHGSARIPSYLARVRAGVLDPTATPSVKTVTPVVAHIDGHNAFGPLCAAAGIDFCVAAARTYGIGMASVRASNHFGMSAWVVQRALDAGMMSLVFTNSSPALPAFGGHEKVLGVSPIAAGAPGPPTACELVGGGDGSEAKVDGLTRDFIIDMAPSTAARGKIYKALRRGEQIPGDWALDEHGAPTTDPAAALKGVMLPMGGPKGSALAIMMDVFSGVLSGGAFAGGVTNPYDPSRPADVSHFLLAIRPDLWMSREEFQSRMGILWNSVVESQKAAGVERIWFPGEIEMETAERRRAEGIPMTRGEIDALNEEARRAGTDELLVPGLREW